MALISVLITDTNIWIDLKNGGILVEVFRLPYRFLIPDFAATELEKPSLESLIVLGIEVHELLPVQVQELHQLNQKYRSLSIIDLAAFLLAKSLGAILLTGESQLNKLANTHRIPVHGILWLLDNMIRYKVLTPRQTANALARMLEQGARLPLEECRKRLVNWSK